MISWLGRSLMILAMFSIVGGHWAVLQSVAWAGMLRDYSRDASIVQAVGKTFGGEYPCTLCKKVAEARKSEDKAPPMLKVDKKSESFTCALSASLLPPLGSDFRYPFPADLSGRVRADDPPQPVPRGAILPIA